MPDHQEVPVPTPATDIDLATAAELGQQLRVDSIRSSTSAGSGHPTSSMSAADLLAVPVSRHLRYDWDNPDTAGNDHLIFSKGHASPLLYSIYKVATLIAIVDVNRLGQRGPTDLGWDLEAYRRRAEAFGARVFEIDGHDVAAIDQALAEAGDLSGERPSVILARTIKGRGASEVEDRENWHGKPLPPDMAERAIVELGGERHLVVRGPAPAQGRPRRRVN